MNTEIHSLLRLGLCPGIGNAYAQKLLTHFGSATAIFDASTKVLSTHIGTTRASHLKAAANEQRIQQELQFIARQEIKPLSILDSDYPQKLKEIPDAPYLLFYKGKTTLNARRQIAVIGSRKNTPYGKEITLELIKGLQEYNITVVSGMAYGIDGLAHRAALSGQLPTIGVLGHGLDRIYPSAHNAIAKEILQQGALLTEYWSETIPDRQNFPMRNRIVAGMTDATIVIETDIKGGAMITAKLALGYNREVFAVPGRVTDGRSLGCNYLIQTQIAQLVTSADDVLSFLGWKETQIKSPAQTKLFADLSAGETQILQLMDAKECIHIDELQLKSGMKSSGLANILLQLEVQGIISTLPGKRYKLN
ncbi:DNA-processing protein DprA [Taibaiella sp. KBW10]|uniref:DNA-processing protein DprA n=1 Tax=Taibaiella sp. KBW10 TaxID=2153357 RepID=UPI0013157B14|nr:DNA-processing protein DprA [Taibaiella sp. KBW10]